MEKRRPASFDAYLVLLIACFIISRIIAFSAGVRFDISALPVLWQFIDPSLLKTQLIESVFYLHTQPPLYNLFLGAVIQAFPKAYPQIFHLLYLLCGMTITILMYVIMVRLKIRPLIACVWTSIFIISPPCLIYENWLFYSYPLCTLLLVLAIIFQRIIHRPSFLSSLALFSCTALIALLRSLFHLGWMILFLCLVLWLVTYKRKQVVLGAILPFALVFAVYAKNAVIFSNFGVSSWFGMNFSRMTTFRLPEETREKLISNGVISEFGRINPFSPVSIYDSWFKRVTPTGIPVLDNKYKSFGVTNYNYKGFIDIYAQYGPRRRCRLETVSRLLDTRNLSGLLLLFSPRP